MKKSIIKISICALFTALLLTSCDPAKKTMCHRARTEFGGYK